MGNPQPSPYGRYVESMGKVQRLNDGGYPEELRHTPGCLRYSLVPLNISKERVFRYQLCVFRALQ